MSYVELMRIDVYGNLVFYSVDPIPLPAFFSRKKIF